MNHARRSGPLRERAACTVIALAIAASLLGTSMTHRSVGAQSHVAIPLDTLHGLQGHTGPLGSVPSNAFDEARTQFRIPARYLPPASDDILSIEVGAQLPGWVHYRSLDVIVGHAASPPPRSRFASNLVDATVVVSLRTKSINYGPSGWTRLLFTTAFRYRGYGDIVVEIQKVLDPSQVRNAVSHQTVYAPKRADLPPTVASVGMTGSGAAGATRGTLQATGTRLMMRLRFRNSPSLVIEGAQATPTRDTFRLGTNALFSVHARRGDQFVLFVDNAIEPAGVPIPGINGVMYLRRPLPWLGGPVDSVGVGRATLWIPPLPLLVGVPFVFQSVRLGTTNDFTNVVDAIVAP